MRRLLLSLTAAALVAGILGVPGAAREADAPRVILISIDGLMPLYEVNDYLGTSIVSEDCDTIGGWVYSVLETLPKVGDRVWFEAYEFVVEEMEQLRIARLTVKVPEESRLRWEVS